MDFFGINIMLRGMVEVMRRSSRGTGRTELLIDSLKDGDRIICLERAEAMRIKCIAKARGVNIDTIACAPERIERMLNLRNFPGHTAFDHAWIEAYYDMVLQDAGRDFDSLQKRLSSRDLDKSTPLVDRAHSLWPYP